MMSINLGAVGVPVLQATGVAGDGSLIVPGAPTDGSLALAFVEVEPAVGEFNGRVRQIMAPLGTPTTTVNFTPNGGSSMPVYAPSGWDFLA